MGDEFLAEDRASMIDRILKAVNPNVRSTPVYFDYKKDARTYRLIPSLDHTAVHFHLDGNLLAVNSEDARHQAEEKKRRLEELRLAEKAELDPSLVDQGVSTRILKNQFNYSDRASQTINNPMRERIVMTDPPPSITFSSTASQWEIYDAYVEEQKMNEKNIAAGKGPGKGKGKEDKTRESRGDTSDDPMSSPAMLTALKIMERTVNQNDNHDILDDYKYWEDESDMYKEEGNLLPLWKFQSDRVRRKCVTCLAWCPAYPDLFAASYGSYEFKKMMHPASQGYIQLFSLKNAFPHGIPAHPEFFIPTDSNVMCLDFHPAHSNLLACGMSNGTVAVFDLRSKSGASATGASSAPPPVGGTSPSGAPANPASSAAPRMRPIYQSNVKTGKHTDPVWQVRWAKATPNSKSLSFFSISSDGRVTQWILSKNELLHRDVMELKSGAVGAAASAGAGMAAGGSHAEAAVDPEAALTGLSGGTCFDFNQYNENMFVVGTEEGLIYKCSKAYNAQSLENLDGHYMAVYAIAWNTFHPDVFLTASADWTVKLWEINSSRPLMSFDLGASVGDVAWAPYSSTVFCAVTASGKVYVFDLFMNKNESLCEQAVVKKVKLTRVRFNPVEPILLVGDERGTVLSLKLSPKLRQKVALEKGQPDDPETLRQIQIDRLNHLIQITLKDRELLDRTA